MDECPAGDPAACPLQRRAEDPRWEAMNSRMDAFDEALQANTALTKEVKANTDNIVALFESGKAFFRVMGLIGTAAKWIGKVAAAVAIVWAVFRYGVLEIIKDVSDGGHGR